MRFDLKGYNLDNLIKMLYLKKVTLYNVTKHSNDHLTFEIDDKDEKKVKRYIANFKVTRTLGKLKRVPKLVATNVGILLGVFIGIIFAIFMSNYTWQIRVYGTVELRETEIIEVLKDNGVRVGKINLASSEDIENILLKNYDRIAQVSVIRQGSAIIINLSEKLVYSEIEYAPITAKFNGIVSEINIITGTSNVKIGDYVNVGDPLVLPFNINSDGEKVSVEPIAEIRGNIFVVYTAELKRTEYVLNRTGKSIKTYHYKLFDLNLFSGKSKNSFALFETVSYNENISRLVPFSRDVTIYYELSPVEITHDLDDERDSLIESSRAGAYELLPTYTKMIDEHTKVALVSDALYATTSITVEGVIND